MLEFRSRFQAFSGFVTFCDMEFKWALTFDLSFLGPYSITSDLSALSWRKPWHMNRGGVTWPTWLAGCWMDWDGDWLLLLGSPDVSDRFIFLHIEFFKYWKFNVKISNSNPDGTDFLPKEWKLDVAIWGNDAGGKTRGKSLFSCVRVWKRINVPDSLNVFYSFIQHLSNSHRFTAHSQQSASTNTKHQKSTGHPADAICVNSITDKRRAALLITTV